MKHKVKVDCENCIFYEQKIKEKDQRIAELEEENAKLQERLETKTWEVEELMHERKRLENDYMKLQEQLKNALVPKFNKNDKVFYISKGKNILPGEVIMFDYYSGKYFILSKCFGFKVDKNMVFPTETEAKKHLKGQKHSDDL